MFLNKEKLTIVYLTTNGLIFYRAQGNRSLSLSFPKEIVSDQEIKNKQQFVTLLTSFINQHKIAPTDMVILISSDLCLSHDFNPANPKTSGEIQSFIESTPFESVGVLNLNREKLITTVTTNKDFYVSLEEVFSKHGFLVTHIVPWAALTLLGLKNKTGFDQTVVQFIISNYIELKDFNFPHEVKQTPPVATVEKEVVKKKSNKQLYVLVGFFVFLLLILALLLLFRQGA